MNSDDDTEELLEKIDDLKELCDEMLRHLQNTMAGSTQFNDWSQRRQDLDQ